MTPPTPQEAEIAGVAELRGALKTALAENTALRCLLGGGCDANNDGLHTVMGTGRNEFCINCGEMTKSGKSKPWFDDARLERTMNRLAHLQRAQGER